MAQQRRDRRTKARDVYGHTNVSFPTADSAAPVVEEADTIRQAATVPAFGSAHPDTTKYPTNFLTFQQTSPGDNTDVNLSQKYVPLPGTKLTSKLTTDWGPATKTVQPNKKAVALTVTATTIDAQSSAVDNVQSEIELTDYDALPSPFAFAYPVDAETLIGTRVLARLNTNGTQGGVNFCAPVIIASASIANPTIITLPDPLPTVFPSISFRNQEWVTIAGDSNTTPPINGNYPATVIDDHHISIPVNVTAVAGSGFGTIRVAAPIEVEIQKLNVRQCIEIWSQIDSSTFVYANSTWRSSIQFPFPEILIALDAFNDTGIATSGLTGSFPTPTQLTWQFGYNTDADTGIRTAQYTAKVQAIITRTYWIGPPTPDTVFEIRTSSGELVMEGFDFLEHHALSIGVSSTGEQTSTSERRKFKTARIDRVLTNGFSSGTVGTNITLKMTASSPLNFTPGDQHLVSSDPTKGRLGTFMKETITLIVPADFPS